MVPLKHHNAQSVVDAFVSVCSRWGPPEVVWSDSGRELSNALKEALCQAFGLEVKHGAVRHPQSQVSAKRCN